MTISSKSVQLWKQGRGIEWTDEAKLAPIDLASMWFQQLGLQLGWDHHEQVIEMLLNGYFADGSDDAPVLSTATPADHRLRRPADRRGHACRRSTATRADAMIMSLARSVAIRTMETTGG